MPIKHIKRIIKQSLHSYNTNHIKGHLLQPSVAPVPTSLRGRTRRTSNNRRSTITCYASNCHNSHGGRERRTRPQRRHSSGQRMPFTIRIIKRRTRRRNRRSSNNNRPRRHNRGIYYYNATNRTVLHTIRKTTNTYFIRLHTRVLSFTFTYTFTFNVIVTTILALTFTNLPRNYLSLHSHSPCTAQRKYTASFPQNSRYFCIRPCRVPLYKRFSLVSYYKR